MWPWLHYDDIMKAGCEDFFPFHGLATKCLPLGQRVYQPCQILRGNPAKLIICYKVLTIAHVEVEKKINYIFCNIVNCNMYHSIWNKIAQRHFRNFWSRQNPTTATSERILIPDLCLRHLCNNKIEIPKHRQHRQ